MNDDQILAEPLVLNNRTQNDVKEDILAPLTTEALNNWRMAMIISVLMILSGGYCLAKTWWDGVGMWGEDKTINWAWDITNFVWWIGIGHAGTLISAILLLFRAKWRNSINRAAEAMTICAVLCSALFIAAHLGRPWLLYYIIPYPNRQEIWVNFNSPLVWDAFAVTTYLTVSVIYWYFGLVPDLGLLANRSKGILKNIYSLLSFGWSNNVELWRRYEPMMLVLAGMATALVVSVHSVVSMDFSTGIVPGWHSTIFPPYFVAGAIHSGFAMVLTLMILVRKLLKLENYITILHIENMNKIVLFMAGLVGLAYLTEVFMAFYSDSDFEIYQMLYKFMGNYAKYYFMINLFNFILPQLLWKKSLRRNIAFSFILSIIVNVGMWMERYVIIVVSLSRDFLPSSWSVFMPTIYDVGVFIFSLGLFFFMFLLFIRYLPVINISEVRAMV